MKADKMGGSMSPRAPTQEPDPDTPTGQWAIHLRSLMESKGLTADKLAGEINKSRAIVFQWLRGDSVPHLDAWPKIASALGLRHWQDLCPPAKKRK